MKDIKEPKNWVGEIQATGERELRLRTISYKGIGRPRNEDYKTVKVKDLRDFESSQMLQAGTSIIYAK